MAESFNGDIRRFKPPPLLQPIHSKKINGPLVSFVDNIPQSVKNKHHRIDVLDRKGLISQTFKDGVPNQITTFQDLVVVLKESVDWRKEISSFDGNH